MPGKQPTEILANIDALLPDLEALYKDIHAHPELSMQENANSGNCCGSSPGCGL